MRKILVSLVLSSALLTACPCEDHQLLMLEEIYQEDGRYALFIDKTNLSYFAIAIDESTNPYEILKDHEILDFDDAVQIFPVLNGLEDCYGLDC